MCRNMHIFTLLFLLIISTNIAFGKSANKTNPSNSGRTHAKHNTALIAKVERMKRSLYDGDEPVHIKTEHLNNNVRHDGDDSRVIERDIPFWGIRGRRDSSSEESDEYASQHYGRVVNKCKNCYAAETSIEHENYIKNRRDELPFWGTRGRRSSEETNEPFWGNRGRRQDSQDDPFWGTRGRRQDDSPFWGNRGRREEEPFWGNRGRRNDEPFWGNRGRREDEPFWGNRGKRKQDSEPFWGNRGRRDEVEPFWGNRGRRKQDLKESILDAINDVQSNIEHLSRLRRSGIQLSFWANRARESKLKDLFSDPIRARQKNFPNYYLQNTHSNSNKEPGTVHDSRLYAEEPHYILVDRSSRSSVEDDPYYISRGKKYFLDLSKAARDRRGAIEEIVKSVRNDPYYIARGKKDTDLTKNNSTASREEFVKAKELICSTMELIMMKNDENKTKRDVNDSERDRRTILKKLAAQLQMDPYFVSRGKKSEEDNLDDFINDVASKCN
ncbi:uncharacterized protein LOC128678091 [Plodia interpunctella]|uniref:uncharacterized protein LOC128678091 n=1 Tax=Plodia interpunctella TaxID=58824 RepID=UPI0023678B4F|nr:uncharacterized protein LOC128678091 [Plodia interpunctella]